MEPMVAVIGVNGFVGRGLPKLFLERGIRVVGVSRSGGGEVEGVGCWQSASSMNFAGCRAVVNLAGESIDRRWSAANRKKFHQSRIGVTQRVVELMRNMPADQRPKVLVNASAVGIYGDRGDEELDEQSMMGDGYLAKLCDEWEQAAMEAEVLGVRVVCVRIGVVLGRGGSAFEKLVRVMRSGLGGKLGNGRQWMPWIHVHDLRRMLVEAVVDERVRGAVNAVAPRGERNADFTRKFARRLRRPAVLPVPAFALRLVLGGFGGVLLASQKVKPAVMESLGFQFCHADFDSALNNLLGSV